MIGHGRGFTNPSLPSEENGGSSQPGYGDAGGMYSLQTPGARAVGFPQMGNAAAIATTCGGGLPPGITGTNDRCTVLVYNLNPDGAMLFGKRLEVNFSNHPNITTGTDTHEYMNSNLNRFNHNTAKNYGYCCSPTKMIHLSTLPQDVTEEEIVAQLEEHGTIVNTKLFKMNGKKQALVLFENEERATEVLVSNHASSLGGSMVRISFSQLQTI